MLGPLLYGTPQMFSLERAGVGVLDPTPVEDLKLGLLIYLGQSSSYELSFESYPIVYFLIMVSKSTTTCLV